MQLDLAEQQADQLLRETRRREPAAVERMRAHPRFRSADEEQIIATADVGDARHVVARESGFESWRRWRAFLRVRSLPTALAASELARAACSNDVRTAARLVTANPALARHDLFAACVCGEVDAVAEFVRNDPDAATANGGPLAREPILYACFSRFLRADSTRAAGIVATVKLLLDAGADASSSFVETSGGVSWAQPCVYGAAGIANNAQLTHLLLDAGARLDDPSIDPRDPMHPAAEVLYHAAEFKDTACLRLILDAGPPKAQVDYCLGRALDFENVDAVDAFLQRGANPNVEVGPPDDRHTLLQKAVRAGRSTQVIDRLIAAGGDWSRVTADDRRLSPTDPRAFNRAARQNDVGTLRAMLNAGADVNAMVGGMSALHEACYAGQFEAVDLLISAGANLHVKNGYGGLPIGATMYGSTDCHDVNGGPGMALPEEVPPRGYAALVRRLIEAGAQKPDHIWGGSDAVQDVLRELGVPDERPEDLPRN